VITGHLTVAGLDLAIAQVASGPTELLDDILVTTFPTRSDDDPAFVRVAVFDAAENVSRPMSRHIAHDAVGTARRWFRTERDPLVALNGAAADLFNPSRPADANPLTTAVWADVRADSGHVIVLRAGRAADGDIALTIDDTTKLWLTAPMLTASAAARWKKHLRLTREDAPRAYAPARRWHDYAGNLPPADWANPPLGLVATPRPELREHATAAETVVIATDGLELDTALTGGRFKLTDHLTTLTARQPPPGMPHAHGDIAAIEITAA
jgi:hypothetical protein